MRNKLFFIIFIIILMDTSFLFSRSSHDIKLYNDEDTIEEASNENNISEIESPSLDLLLQKAGDLCYAADPNGGFVLSHLGEFIFHAHVMDEPVSYLRSIFKLFSNILKGTEYINAYQFYLIVESLSRQLNTYMRLEKTHSYLRGNIALYEEIFLDRFKAVTNNLLYAKFSTEFSLFKDSPDIFLENIAQEVMEIAKEEVDIAFLQQSLVKFLEVSISKLVWSPYDQEKTWESVKKISNQLAFLVEQNIISDLNDLDDLFWSLIHRYCYFIDVSSSMLPPSFYQAVRADIANQQLILLDLEEQDKFIEPKIERLRRVLVQAEAKSRGHQEGIIAR